MNQRSHFSGLNDKTKQCGHDGVKCPVAMTMEPDVQIPDLINKDCR